MFKQKALWSLLTATLLMGAVNSGFAATTVKKPTPAPAPKPAPPVVIPQADVTSLASLRLDTIRTALSGIWQQGLNPQTYWTPDFEQAFAQGTLDAQSAPILASFLQALKDVYVGTVNPQSLSSSDIIYTKKAFLNVDQMKVLVDASGGDANVLLQSIDSQFPLYLSLKAAVVRLYPASLNGSWPAFTPLKKTLRLGVKDPAVLQLKQRLVQLGYQIDTLDNNFDATTRAAVLDIQLQLKFNPDGTVSPGGRTWAYVGTSAQDRLLQVRADIEKMRWLNQTPESRYIFVNTAFTTFELVDHTTPDSVGMSFRTINGRPGRKTPSMKDKLVYIIFNPFWTIPPTVFIQDKVQDLRNLDWWGIEDYFQKNNFEVVDDNDHPIDAASIDWGNIKNANVNFYIKQFPNYMNALGVVKFMLTNPYAIYLHDTDEREVFPEPNRMISSGCIRLEKPLDLAEYLLKGTEWDREKIDDFVVKPGDVLDKETHVNIPFSVPVYILPVTSQISSDGVLRFTDDVYGHNQLIYPKLQALGN